MLKKIALATAIAAIASSAFAMEALDEETLSATTGQAGLTITTSANVTVDALRYTDGDGAGVSGAAFDAIGAYNTAGAAMTPPRAAMNLHQSRGTLMIEDLAISSTGNIVTTLDVGSEGGPGPGFATGATDKTSLFITSSINGLNVSLGRISLDNGGVMDYDVTANSGAGATTAANGGAAFGGVNLKDITLTNSAMKITPGGNSGNGITITTLRPMDISLDFEYIDDATPAVVGPPAAAATQNGIFLGSSAVGDQGIDIKGLSAGGMTIDATASGLRIGQGATHINSVQLGGTSGIRIGDNVAGAASIGQVGLIGINMGASVMTVAGH